MRQLFFLALITALLSSGCSIFSDAGSGSYKTSKTAKTAKNVDEVKPVTYSSTSAAQTDYVSLYKDAAMTEMDRGGVPASIILAQGLLESAAGQSDLARTANNHFGIKCGGGWNGKTYYKQDDDKDANGKPTESCFRSYGTVSESFFDHAEFLRDPRKYNRYGFLFNLDRTDYKGWARGLQSAGYATSQTYSTQLIDLIERYKLYEYDRPGGIAGSPAPSPGATPPVVIGPSGKPEPAPLTARIGRVNDVKLIMTREGETLDDVARAYRINTDKVVNYNDYGYPPGVRLKPGTRIYIQCKKDKWHGRASEHFVRDGQTMFDIAQQYGMKLDKLRERNGLQAGQEPAIGEKILLKGNIKSGQNIRLRDTSNDPLKPGEPGNPSAPSTSQGDKMTTGDELPFVIGEDDPKPQPTTPTTPTPPTTQPPLNRPPSTTGTPYPPLDPVPNQPNNGWQQPGQPTTPTQPQAAPGYHIVVKGDTLYSIARKYNTTVARLKQSNRLPDDGIKIGQTLKVN